MARIGYARVSTIDQDLDTQLTRLKAEGCGVIRSEKVSGGSRAGRSELATIIEFLRPGDELERFPITWNHVIDKESLKIKTLEQVLFEKVCQLFRNLL